MDVPCQWNQNFTKNIKPKSIEENAVSGQADSPLHLGYRNNSGFMLLRPWHQRYLISTRELLDHWGCKGGLWASWLDSWPCCSSWGEGHFSLSIMEIVGSFSMLLSQRFIQHIVKDILSTVVVAQAVVPPTLNYGTCPSPTSESCTI